MLLRDDDSIASVFPEVHREAVLRIEFRRTLRVPDDGQHHSLPPGLGRFPLRAIDALDPARVPETWRRRGDVMMPMWQAEACWLNVSSPGGYPFLLKIAAGKINAVNGAPWRSEPDFDGQDYVEIPRQPWIDGFKVDERTVRQFVAMPLGRGYTVEEQVTGEAEEGGVQLLAHPLKGEVWTRRQAERRHLMMHRSYPMRIGLACESRAEMRLGARGSIRQKIERARERASDWDLSARARCFVHLANSEVWRALTGEAPPTVPPSAAQCRRPHARGPALVRVVRRGAARAPPPPENESFPPPRPVRLRRRDRLEGAW